jgi:hypothetical protein
MLDLTFYPHDLRFAFHPLILFLLLTFTKLLLYAPIPLQKALSSSPVCFLLIFSTL